MSKQRRLDHDPSGQRRPAGFSLVEILVVIAIVALAMGGAVYGFRAMTKSELRGSATRLGGAIRYCFDRSVTTGAYFRVVLDLDANKYWAERSDERMYLSRDKEAAPGNGKAFDVDALDRQRQQEEQKERESFLSRAGSLAVALEPPPRPKRAKFQSFKDAALPLVTLKKARLFDVYTPRQREPYTSGRAYLYFFPDGHTEKAVIRLNDGESFYSLIVHPLSGRVEVQNGRAEIPREFDTRDEEGHDVAPR